MTRRTYRLITVADAPFGTFPPYSEGGPSKVTATSWGTSQSSLCRILSSDSIVEKDDGKITLNVYGRDPETGEFVKHPLDGTKYATSREADEAAYNAGLLAIMVYDDSKWAALVPAEVKA